MSALKSLMGWMGARAAVSISFSIIKGNEQSKGFLEYPCLNLEQYRRLYSVSCCNKCPDAHFPIDKAIISENSHTCSAQVFSH